MLSIGIAVSGTVGAGLFITLGEVIGLAGSLGGLLAYIFAGLVVASVMLCLSEMVSHRSVAGALFDYPSLYVDPALGFATGISYWYDPQCNGNNVLTAIRVAYTMSTCTLTVTAATILQYWGTKLWVAVLICLLPMWFSNLFGSVWVRISS
jgi:amino acid permease